MVTNNLGIRKCLRLLVTIFFDFLDITAYICISVTVEIIKQNNMKKLLFALFAMLFAACTTDVTEDVAIEIPETLDVSFEADSRIQLQNSKTVWTADDLVSVFYRSDANQKWKFQGNTGDRSGKLKCSSSYTSDTKLPKVVVVYPYNENYYINPQSCNVEATLPATQTYIANSYGLDGNIMVSSSEYNQVYLRSICGWLEIQIEGAGQAVEKITLKGNNGEQVAGQLYIDTTDASVILAENIAESDDNGLGGMLEFDNTILTEVSLNCGGTTLSSTAKAFYIALPPQEFSKGITIDIECNDGSKMTKSTTNTVTIKRNTILPMTAFAYDGVVPEVFELNYTTNNGEPLDPYTTEGFGANFVENIFDAATGKGVLKFDGRITTIPEKAFVACTNLTQIELTKDITTINAEAFSSCTKLTTINIPQSVKTIGNKAFCNCSSIAEITIPSSVTSIGTSSFEDCGGKATINCNIPNDTASSGKFYKAKFTEVVIGDRVTRIGDNAFYSCKSLTNVTIGNGVTNIANKAFCLCTLLASITIPDSVTSIGEYAFQYCDSLKNIIIPDGVTKIGRYAFYECTSLTSITIPDSVTLIDSVAFSGCTSLKEVHYNGDLSAWCNIDFGTYNANPMHNGAKLYLNDIELTEAIIPSDIIEIKNYIFYGCTSLTSVTLNKRVTLIERSAFENCTSLTSITIPDSVASIKDHTFSGCTSLKEVNYNGDLSAWCKIDFNNTYSNPMCNGAKLYLSGVELTEATIPSDITDIKDYAFTGCTSLANATLHQRITSIGENAFSDCTSLISITIPDGITKIGYSVFSRCTSLASITIPDGVTTIEQYAFFRCSSLTSITIPNSVTSIHSEVFYDCTSLKEVYCKPTTPPNGPSSAFHNNASDRKIYVPRASVDAYKEAQYWCYYKSDIEPYDF